MEEIRGQLVTFSSVLYHVGTGDPTQVAGLGDWGLYPLNHLAGPINLNMATGAKQDPTFFLCSSLVFVCLTGTADRKQSLHCWDMTLKSQQLSRFPQGSTVPPPVHPVVYVNHLSASLRQSLLGSGTRQDLLRSGTAFYISFYS